MKYLDFLGRLNELTIVDIPHYIADKTLTQTINRIELDIGNEQLLEKVENICDIKQKIKQSLYDCSLNGASIVYLEKLTNGNVIIKMENIAAIEDIIYNGDEIVGVKLRKTITVDKDIFIVETLFDTQQVSNKFYGKSEMEGLKEIDTEIFTTRIPTYSYIAEVWQHDLGKVPLWIIPNKEVQQPYETLTDTYNCNHLIEVYNATSIEFVADLVVSHNRIIGNSNSQFEIRNDIYLDSQGKVLQLNNDLVYLASVGRTFLNATGDGKPEILSANTSKLAEYLTARQKILDEILNCAGLSSQAMTSAQKTAAESTSKYSFIIEKINTKIDLLKKYWSKILETFFFVYGTDIKNNYTFEIKYNIAIFEANVVDEIIKEIQVGSKTPIDMIMTKNNCSEKIANEIYAKNEKWFKEHDYRQITKQEGIVSGVNVPLSK